MHYAYAPTQWGRGIIKDADDVRRTTSCPRPIYENNKNICGGMSATIYGRSCAFVNLVGSRHAILSLNTERVAERERCTAITRVHGWRIVERLIDRG